MSRSSLRFARLVQAHAQDFHLHDRRSHDHYTGLEASAGGWSGWNCGWYGWKGTWVQKLGMAWYRMGFISRSTFARLYPSADLSAYSPYYSDAYAPLSICAQLLPPSASLVTTNPGAAAIGALGQFKFSDFHRPRKGAHRYSSAGQRRMARTSSNVRL